MRFAIGTSKGPRGLVWSASVKSDELYLGTRRSPWKVSVHGSGVWRIAFTAEWAKSNSPEGRDRVVARWNRPPEMAPGLTHALTIAVPHEALAVAAAPEIRHVAWCPAPNAGEIAWFGIMEGRPGYPIELAEEAAAQGSTVVGELRLGDRPIAVTYSVASQTDAERRIIAEIRRGEADKDPLTWWPLGQDPTVEPGRRIVVFGETRSSRGSRHLFEMWIPDP